MLTPALAVDVDSYTLFELEPGLGSANAINDTGNDSGIGLPDDWEDIYKGAGHHSALVTTGIVNDPSPETIFEGGNKDILPLDQLGWKNGTVPDKSEISNAYAAAYDAGGGELHIYFGADRIANNGDTFLGFWFFKSTVKAEGDGTFSGTRTNGDVLVLLNFPQATNAHPLVEVYNWDDTCAKKDGPNPAIGQCAATNLRLIAHNEDDGAVCGLPGAEDVCGNTNNVTRDAPWPYQAKTGETDFPFETFFEGGINLSALGLDGCFSSFMAESRASESPTAQLKDFVLRDFELCGIEITKECGQAYPNATEDAFLYDINGTVTNTGFGTLYDIEVYDTTSEPDQLLATHAELAAGNSFNYSGTFESALNGLTNEVEVLAAPIDGGVKSVGDTATAECESLTLSPVIDVAKYCGITGTSEGVRLAIGEDGSGNDAIILLVDFEGMVCNTTEGGGANGPIGLTNVTVVDDSGTPGDTSDDQTLLSGVNLAPGACANFSGTYTPGVLPLNGGLPITDPSLVSFSDTVTATGTANLGFGDALDTDSATCPICLEEQ